MKELTSCCIRVTERRGGDLPCERCRLPPPVHSSFAPIISKGSNTWQIHPAWGLLSFFLFKRGFLPHLERMQRTSTHCNLDFVLLINEIEVFGDSCVILSHGYAIG